MKWILVHTLAWVLLIWLASCGSPTGSNPEFSPCDPRLGPTQILENIAGAQADVLVAFDQQQLAGTKRGDQVIRSYNRIFDLMYFESGLNDEGVFYELTKEDRYGKLIEACQLAHALTDSLSQ